MGRWFILIGPTIDVTRWLNHAGEDLILVGGQAIAVWERALNLPLVCETHDIDFLGDAEEGLRMAREMDLRCQIGGSTISGRTAHRCSITRGVSSRTFSAISWAWTNNG